MKHMQKKSIQGFTLIEMLIVIAVISILAGIVLVGVTGFQETARDTKRIGDLRGVQNSLELYYTRCGFYPQTTGGGANCSGGANITTWAQLAQAMVNVGIISDESKLPVDPKSTNDAYAYESPDGFVYILRATLENPSSALDDSGVEIDAPDAAFSIDCDDDNNYYCIGSS